MGQFFETLPPSLIPWLLEQKVFYIASAPLSGDGHVNVSPKGVSDKGGPFFGVIKEPKPNNNNNNTTTTSSSQANGHANSDDAEKNVVVRQFWYMDLTGSGIETTSHLHEPGNGRITVMFNAFTGPPRILRIFGKGTPLEYGTPEFSDIVKSQGINIIPGTRSVILVDIHQVGTSCGFSVPTYQWVGFRPTLNDFFEKRVKAEREGKREDGIERYWAHKNQLSMDNLPGMQRGVRTAASDGVKPIKKMVGAYAPSPTRQPRRAGGPGQFSLAHVVLAAVLGMLAALALGVAVVRFGDVDVCLNGARCVGESAKWRGLW